MNMVPEPGRPMTLCGTPTVLVGTIFEGKVDFVTVGAIGEFQINKIYPKTSADNFSLRKVNVKMLGKVTIADQVESAVWCQ